MRVFYIDEEELKQSKRRYYVKVDNVDVPEELKGYKAIEAASVEELKSEIMKYYMFKEHFNIQLWTAAGYSGKRLDQMDKIPLEYEFLWVRGVTNKDNK
jgi:hypothetical protein